VLRIGSLAAAPIVESSSSSAPSVASKNSARSAAVQFPHRHWSEKGVRRMARKMQVGTCDMHPCRNTAIKG
jgi:hypothetical protein